MSSNMNSNAASQLAYDLCCILYADQRELESADTWNL